MGSKGPRWYVMSSLIARLKILPTDAGIKSSDIVESIREKLPEGMVVKNETEEPIAFGVVASILDIQFEEKEGEMDALEKAVRSSPLVSQVDVIGVSRVSASLK
ncbi:MAG: elongation factor 1-beta [Nitrososphaerales archaeon]